MHQMRAQSELELTCRAKELLQEVEDDQSVASINSEVDQVPDIGLFSNETPLQRRPKFHVDETRANAHGNSASIDKTGINHSVLELEQNR